MITSRLPQKVTRRTLLRGVAAVASVALTRSRGATEYSTAEGQLFCVPLASFRASLSVSPFTEQVLRKTSLTDESIVARTVAATQQLYMRHGATEVYARIATRRAAPQGSIAEHGWERGLERARLARDLDLPFNPELGLWAEYGDGGNYQQPPDFHDFPEIKLPGPWLSLSLAQMLPAIRLYATIMARRILATGVRVEIWDIGNEVEPGIAGVTVRPLQDRYGQYQPPNGVNPAIGLMSTVELLKMTERERIDWCTRHLWPNTGRILAAAADGIRSVDRKARFSTHISPLGGTTAAWPSAFYSTCKAAGFFPAMFGFSFYPGGNKSFDGPNDAFELLRETSAALMKRYGRPSFIAEGGVASGKMAPPFLFNNPVEHFGLNEAGQYTFNRDMIAWGARSGDLAGYRPWAPDLCFGEWAPMSWFDRHDSIARAKPVMRAYEQALPSLYAGVERDPGGLQISLKTTGAPLVGVSVEVRDERGTFARGQISELRATWTRVLTQRNRRPQGGPYRVLVSCGERMLMDRRILIS